ncbi:MAG TPA: ABC transporter ATP-binding protein [Vitreimonas sp.]|nr:ABC transporter ATP-binding protein [Vitreimonas sp.]
MKRQKFEKLAETAGEKSTFSWWHLLRSIWFFAQPIRNRFIFWNIVLFCVFFYPLLPPFILGRMVDFLTVYRPGMSLQPFYLWVGLFGVSWGVISIIRLSAKNQMEILTLDIVYRIKVSGFQKLLDFSLTWHEKENTGNKVQRIEAGANGVSDFLALLQEKLYDLLSTLIGVTVVFFIFDLKYFVLIGVYAMVFFLIEKFFYNRINNKYEEFNMARENASGKYYEGLSNILSIKSLGMGKSLQGKVASAEALLRAYNQEISALNIYKWKFFQVDTAVVSTIFLYMLGSDVLAGRVSLGSVFIFYSYFNDIRKAINDMTGYFERLVRMRLMVSRMMPLFWTDLDARQGTLAFPAEWQSIELKNLDFKYQHEATLSDINLIIKRGDQVGIVGSSGSGKSTLAKLLLGLYTPTRGHILIGKRNLSDISHDELTTHVTVVPQESEMFNFSLRENITSMKNIPEEILLKAIKIAQLAKLISKLPEGLETLIGERGYRVSGGERQRIALARAICKQSQILILDEATSHLDTATEEKIHAAIEKELKGVTIIAIAHRTSTLKNTDYIYHFEKGRLIKKGTYKELFD